MSMQSNPFPGMNPFMESSWSDVHMALIGFIRQELGEVLPEDLSAKAEMRVTVLGGEAPYYKPDLAIVQDSWKQGIAPSWSPASDSSGILATDPLIYEVDEVTHRWIEIRSDQGELITVIEVMSPVNKQGGREAYIAKRDDLVAAGVNVVEIDLLRQGRRTVNVENLSDFEKRFPKGAGHYFTCVTRGHSPHRREVYATTLRDPLPTIRIPLRITDRDVPLSLQALIDQCYTTGRYWKMRYDTALLEPPVSLEDKEWLAERISTAGLQPQA